MLKLVQKTGFTLIELMIAIAIIGVLAVVSIPVYTRYVAKSHYNAVIMAANVLKGDIATQIRENRSTTNCTAVAATTPNSANKTPGQEVSTTCIITVTPWTGNGLKATDTYVLTPTWSNGTVTWTNSGSGCLASKLCDLSTS
jgi:type IV pilus assembly protein PilA